MSGGLLDKMTFELGSGTPRNLPRRVRAGEIIFQKMRTAHLRIESGKAGRVWGCYIVWRAAAMIRWNGDRGEENGNEKNGWMKVTLYLTWSKGPFTDCSHWPFPMSSPTFALAAKANSPPFEYTAYPGTSHSLCLNSGHQSHFLSFLQDPFQMSLLASRTTLKDVSTVLCSSSILHLPLL